MTRLYVTTKIKGLWKVKTIAYLGMPLVFLRLVKLDDLLEYAASFIKFEISEVKNDHSKYKR